ncbi:alpha/beta fold hydrolase [Pseudohoeflea coraliihabitans]|uniref:Alpha/beta hydrolase n=1 Tax=Pseudohoeflea coraliihabitans TaxID=2860393 RepID=A0ABS6WKX3_9HYPH|nr:alpha/beta hydrolase [Pseudohoeflea sp. DP4N28-3]MBW3096606.1 alpha/beta hydrolase [Pseudohoeflea sp. DP4N28-3]
MAQNASSGARAPRPFYVTTAAGQVRLWQIGEGPDLVLLGGLIDAAEDLAARAGAALPGWRVTVAELPGIGGSAGVNPQSADACAEALSEALAWLGRGKIVLGGVDLAMGLTALVARRLDAEVVTLPVIGRRRAQGWRKAKILPPELSPRQDGSHLQALWSFLRDRHLLKPDNPGLPATRGEPLPDDAALSRCFVAAAVNPQRFAALWNLCLDLAGDDVAGSVPVDHIAGLGEALSAPSFTAGGQQPPATAPLPDRQIWHDYVETANGRMHLRRAGGAGRPILVIPTGGGSSSQFAPVVRGLAKGTEGERAVFAVDYLGNGLSEKSRVPVDIGSLAKDMIALIDAMEIDQIDVWGSHTGSLVALEMAVIAPERVGKLVMEGPVFISADFQADLLEHYFPKIEADKWGLHLPLVWNWRRDLFMFWPWYRVERDAARALGVPDAEELHMYAIGILESGASYDGAYRSAFSYDTRSRLPQLTRPALICAGPNDMLKDGLVESRQLGPKGLVEVCETPTTVWWPNPDPAEAEETLALYRDFLA